MCDKEKAEKLESMRLSSVLPTLPKSANLALTKDSEQAISYRNKQTKKKKLYIKRLYIYHVKTMCFIHSYP